jgi:E3 ubiquitin-protein ligase HUWE1
MIIQQNPSLLFGTFKVIIRKMPNIISFENRRKHFYEEIMKLNHERYAGSINLQIRRKYIFEDSF